MTFDTKSDVFYKTCACCGEKIEYRDEFVRFHSEQVGARSMIGQKYGVDLSRGGTTIAIHLRCFEELLSSAF